MLVFASFWRKSQKDKNVHEHESASKVLSSLKSYIKTIIIIFRWKFFVSLFLCSGTIFFIRQIKCSQIDFLETDFFDLDDIHLQ